MSAPAVRCQIGDREEEGSLVWAMSDFTTLTFGPPSAESTVVPYTDQVTDPTVVAWS